MSKKPTTWDKMTDAEKGALLVAWQKGEAIQYWDLEQAMWVDTYCDPLEFEGDAYRVKVMSKREVAKFHLGLWEGDVVEGRVWFSPVSDTPLEGASAILHMPLVDGEFDLSQLPSWYKFNGQVGEEQ